jgi:hypothetical protein
MGFDKDRKVRTKENILYTSKTNALTAIGRAGQYLTDLNNLKNTVSADGDFTADYTADIQSAIDEVTAAINALLP